MITFTAKNWLAIFNFLRDSGNADLAGRISHDLGHVWNSEDWDTTVALDFSEDHLKAVKHAAKEIGV
ncbi:MAG TPA: hypothetical protein VHR86_07400 [Armatimonadota bacterium]|nr:hypothetical protein [Armatimonadota bacterium]